MLLIPEHERSEIGYNLYLILRKNNFMFIDRCSLYWIGWIF